MTGDMSQFYQVFFEETAEHLAHMESLLLGMDVEAPSLDDLNAVFRAAHSIKGGSGTFGFTDMTGVTHILETLLDRLRKQELALRADMVDAFLAAGDVLRAQLRHHEGGEPADPAQIAEVCARLAELSDGGGAAHGADPGYGFFDDAPGVPSAASGDDDFGFFDDAPGAPAAAAADDGFGFFDDAPGAPGGSGPDEGFGFFDDAPGAPAAAGEAGFGFFDDAPGAPPVPAAAGIVQGEGFGFFDNAPGAPAATPAPVPPAASAPAGADAVAPHPMRRATDQPGAAGSEASSIRVAVEKVDQLINLVGELVITQAMIADAAGYLDPVQAEKLLAGIDLLSRNARDLQESVMSIRMLPMSMVFSRFPRVVRDVAGKLQKQVELKTVGENTELDKGLIEKLTDPLTHLIRNSLDHGIETPDKRLAAGKPAKGTLTLKAAHQGGNIVIEVIDDGAGLNRGKILAKARERGLAVNDGMSDAEVWQLIFAPGFSTADQITDVSGRGVGMDVVKRNIEGIGGKVELESITGHGTRTVIRLPLTLAILDGMSVGVGGETFIVPLTAIVESLQPVADDLKSMGGDSHLLHIRGEYLPLVPLASVLGMPWHGDFARGIVVVVEAETGKAALFVDELLGQHQVVIKSLEANYRRIPGISGATIMGDGSVALILDLSAVIRAGIENNPHRKAA